MAFFATYETETMKIDSFDPLKHGFHFCNSGFFNHVFGLTTRGLCGGMSMSALDYWPNGIATPNPRTGTAISDGKSPADPR